MQRDRNAGAAPSDSGSEAALGSVVDRLLALAASEPGDAVDRAEEHRRRLQLSRVIKGLIDGEDRRQDRAA